MKQKFRRQSKPCPIEGCTYESLTFIDLQKHMVESKRHSPTEHQRWLTDALGVEFADYAFKMDRRIADLFAEYCTTINKNLPNDPLIFNVWLAAKHKQSRRTR